MEIEELPEELLAEIFQYLTDPITASQVCSYFYIVATTQVRSIKIKLSSEKIGEITKMKQILEEFRALKKMKLDVSFDVYNIEKSRFCFRFSDKITSLVLKEMTFLNPFIITQPNLSFTNLTTLKLKNSDLSSCSSQICDFILHCCPQLKNLIISGCSGLEIESLNSIGKNLNRTQIENFQLLPTFSYFDVSPTTSAESCWTIENLKTLSIRSKLVVMKKNFVKNVIMQRSEKLTTLELIAELNLGESLASKIIENYPNLEKLSLGSGCTQISNEDFSNLCNFYQKLKSFEFHFSRCDFNLDLKNLRRNESIVSLKLGMTKNVTLENLATIAKCLPNVSRLNITLYCISSSTQEFLSFVIKMFPNVQHLEFQRTGKSDNMKFTAIKEEIDSPRLRHFDEIRNLTN